MTSKLTPELWEKARAMRVNGASLSAIAREIGVSRQAVAKRERKEQWLNQNGEPGPTEGMNPKQAVVANLRRGCPTKVAAGAVGVHPNTVWNWRKQDQDFDAECWAASSLYGADRIRDLTKASERGDTRATIKALENHEATRSDFAPKQSSDNLVIVLQIDRTLGPASITGETYEHDGPKPLVWPNSTPIEGACTEITNGEQEK